MVHLKYIYEDDSNSAGKKLGQPILFSLQDHQFHWKRKAKIIAAKYGVEILLTEDRVINLLTNLRPIEGEQF